MCIDQILCVLFVVAAARLGCCAIQHNAKMVVGRSGLWTLVPFMKRRWSVLCWKQVTMMARASTTADDKIAAHHYAIEQPISHYNRAPGPSVDSAGGRIPREVCAH